jgi:riboflavin synthase
MFSGIVVGTGTVTALSRYLDFLTLTLELPGESHHGLELGASVAIDGVCLTVTERKEAMVSFDVIAETVRVTSLSELVLGDRVNIERSLTVGQEIGGHNVSGHVDGTASISRIEQTEYNCSIELQMDSKWISYIFPKGFIALNGVSLTVGAVDYTSGQFSVHLIPETLRRTSFLYKTIGAKINFEVERNTQVIVDAVSRCLTPLVEAILKSAAPTTTAEAISQAIRSEIPGLAEAFYQQLRRI